MAAISTLEPEVGVEAACEALGVPRSTGYRWRKPPVVGCARLRPRSPRALPEETRREVRQLLYSERFVNQSPATVHARLMDEDQRYICHPRTMYRVLHDDRGVRERRPQLNHPTYAKPELLATAPCQVWTWDVTWMRGPERYVYYPLYVIMDLFSRFNPGWMLAHEESGEHAKHLFEQACARQGIEPGSLTLHADRGPVPKGKTMKQLMQDLDVTPSFSRPRVSNDNPFSEAQFKTMKYGPEYPSRFASFEHAREYCQHFFPWYNDEHRHSGIAYLTPSDVHHGRADAVVAQRQAVMDGAYARTPERFPAGPPRVPRPPKAVWINPPENRDEVELTLH